MSKQKYNSNTYKLMRKNQRLIKNDINYIILKYFNLNYFFLLHIPNIFTAYPIE
jgi:hypothetical protein